MDLVAEGQICTSQITDPVGKAGRLTDMHTAHPIYER